MTYRSSNKGRKSFFLRSILIITIIAVSGLAYGYSRYQYLLETPLTAPEKAEEYSFRVNRGDTVKQISKKLTDQNLILDGFTFDLHTRLSQTDKSLKAGVYKLNTGMSIRQIVDTLQNAEPTQVVLTVPEGYTVYQIDQMLAAMGLIEANQFNQAVQNFSNYEKYSFIDQDKVKSLPHLLEGYLFPDTYFLDANDFQSETLISLMLNNFKNKIIPEIEAVEQKRSIADIITVASMVEAETNQDQDRPIVADIIWRRLDSGWMLGIDATLLYQKEDRTIDFQDLQEDSPYNTRKRAGMPPGPIGNPGLKSIRAAITPESNPYFFYLTGKDGKNYYAISNDEHNANKKKYLN